MQNNATYISEQETEDQHTDIKFHWLESLICVLYDHGKLYVVLYTRWQQIDREQLLNSVLTNLTLNLTPLNISINYITDIQCCIVLRYGNRLPLICLLNQKNNCFLIMTSVFMNKELQKRSPTHSIIKNFSS